MKALKKIRLEPLNPHIFPDQESGQLSIARLFRQRGPLRGGAMFFPGAPIPGQDRIIWTLRCYKYFVPAALNSVALIALLVLLIPIQAQAQAPRPTANETIAILKDQDVHTIEVSEDVR
jgi:hypothetical protein